MDVIACPRCGNAIATNKNTHKTMKNATKTIDLCPIDRMISFLTMRYAFRYNTVLNCTEYRPVALPADSFTPLYPRMLRRIILEVQREGIEVSPNDIRNYIESDYVRQFDPVGDYLASCEGAWDGHDHIGDLARTVPTDAPLWHKWFKTWLLAMVSQWQNQPSRLYGNSVAPLLISPQGYHKSTFCRRLLPDALKWGYTDSLALSDRRQVMFAMSQQLLINLDEFNQISPRVQQGFLKNIIQLPSVKVKRPFGTHIEELPRKASFIATSNMTDILSDPSGNRRFIGIELTAPIDTSRVPDHRQLFAQALQLLRNGSRSWFDKAETEQIMLWNRRYEIQEPADQYFSLCFSVAYDPLDPSAEWLSTAEIFDVIKQKVGSSLQVNTLIAFGRKLANMPGMRRRKCETCTRYLVKRVGL